MIKLEFTKKSNNFALFAKSHNFFLQRSNFIYIFFIARNYWNECNNARCETLNSMQRNETLQCNEIGTNETHMN